MAKAKTQEAKVQALNEALYDLFNIMPIDNPTSTYEQKSAMAHAFSTKGFRDFMAAQAEQKCKDLIKVTDMADLLVAKGRILMLKELYGIAKQCYDEYNQLKKNNLL